MIAGDVLSEKLCSHVWQKHSRMGSTQISRTVLSLQITDGLCNFTEGEETV